MIGRTYRKLRITDLQLLLKTRNDADALEIWEIDEENARLFLSNPMNYFFACIDNDRIIGYVCGHELNRLDTASNMLYIHGVGVHADYRHQGIGRELLNGIKTSCKLSGISKMFLFTEKSNIAACALYNSIGGHPAHDDDVAYFFNNLD